MRRIGLAGDPELVKLLDWPRRTTPELGKEFELYQSKGGSLPGVITEASYIRPRGRPGVAAVLFLYDLPPEIEAVLGRSFTQQQLILRLATDEAFQDHARTVLAGD